MKTALVTGARAPAALEMVRLLSRAGYRVVSCDSVRFALASSSRASSCYYRHSSPAVRPREFVDQLRDIVRRECVDLLVPICEEAFYIAEHGQLLREECVVFLPEHQLMQTAHHKGDFIEFAGCLGLRVPRTRVISRNTQVAQIGEEWGTELVLKPVHGRFASQVQLSPSPVAIQKLVISERVPWVVQERIEGSHLASYSLAREGVLTAHAAYRCEERLGDGATLRFQNLADAGLAKQVESWVQTYTHATDWTGQVAFDFIVNDEGLFAIECNPRATSGVHLFRDGERFAAAMLGQGKSVLRPSRELIRQLILPRVAMGLRGLEGAPWRDILCSQDVVSSWQDPVPGFFQLMSAAEVSWQAVRRGCSLLEATTWDIEYNGGES